MRQRFVGQCAELKGVVVRVDDPERRCPLESKLAEFCLENQDRLPDFKSFVRYPTMSVDEGFPSSLAVLQLSQTGNSLFSEFEQLDQTLVFGFCFR